MRCSVRVTSPSLTVPLSTKSIHLRRSIRHSSTVSPAKKPPFHIWFLGNDHFSIGVLKHIRSAPDTWQSLRIVVGDHRVSVGTHRKKQWTAPLQTYAEAEKLQCFSWLEDRDKWWPRPSSPSSPSSVPDDKPNSLLITASFGQYLRGPLLRAFEPDRALNVHPSLLPDLRGPAPIQNVLLRGSTMTGVSVISTEETVKGVDAGPVWAQREVAIKEDDDFSSLRDRLADVGGEALVGVMRKMRLGEARSIPQPTEHTWAPKPTLELSLIDWNADSHADILRRHRALEANYKIRTELPSHLQKPGSRFLILGSVQAYTGRTPTPGLESPGQAVYNAETECLHFRCVDGAEVMVGEVLPQSKKRMSAKEWWNGIRDKTCIDFNVRGG